MRAKCSTVVFIAFVLFSALNTKVHAEPTCAPHDLADPASYGELNAEPALMVWRDLTLEPDENCLVTRSGTFQLVISMTARFESTASLETLATRLGNISATAGMRYWSVTERRWRVLIKEAFAIESASNSHRRANFSADEILSDKPLYFQQDDTRSIGWNTYAIRGQQLSPEALVVDTHNITPIRLLLATLFEADSIYTTHYLRRLSATEWGYHGLFTIRAGAGRGNERSLINRAAAFYRYLAGPPNDDGRPLAP